MVRKGRLRSARLSKKKKFDAICKQNSDKMIAQCKMMMENKPKRSKLPVLRKLLKYLGVYICTVVLNSRNSHLH